MLQLTGRSKIYFFFLLIIILLSVHNTNSKTFLDNYFKIKKISLTGEIDQNLTSKISKSLDEIYNYNIFSLNSFEIVKILENLNIINDYKIKKEYPSTIKIEFRETKILAYFFKNNQKIYIGENSKIIIDARVENNNLPLVIGKFDVNKFLRLKKLLIDNGFIWEDFTEFYSFNSNRWDLVYKNKITIKLPIKDLNTSLNLLKKIINNQNTKNFKVIDLRLKDRVILS